jgi:hypothetical protein
LAGATPPSSMNPGQAATPTKRLETALAAWEVQAHRTLAASPDPADLVRVARVQALITSTTSILTEAAAQKGHIDADVMRRLTPSLEASQMAWTRMAKRWGELTNPASRTDPALVAAASEVRAAIAATATNQAGWATPDQLASRLDLPHIVKTLHLSMVTSIEIAYVVRDTAADHPGLTAPARIIGMRSQGEAEIAIEQGETRYEGVTWATRRQLATNQLIPLPEPARRGLINLADDVLATTNQAVAPPLNSTPATSPDQPDPVNERISGAPSSRIRSPTRVILHQKDHADELHISHHSRIDGRRIVPFDGDLLVYSLGSVQGCVASCRPRPGSRSRLSARRCERPGHWNGPVLPQVLPCRPGRCGPSESSRVFAPSCRELRAPKSGGRVMFGRCQSCLHHRSEPITGANDER